MSQLRTASPASLLFHPHLSHTPLLLSHPHYLPDPSLPRTPQHCPAHSHLYPSQSCNLSSPVSCPFSVYKRVRVQDGEGSGAGSTDERW